MSSSLHDDPRTLWPSCTGLLVAPQSSSADPSLYLSVVRRAFIFQARRLKLLDTGHLSMVQVSGLRYRVVQLNNKKKVGHARIDHVHRHR